MVNNNVKYFSTGEFAKLCDINKKTLFHYDNIDLLKPEKVESNGYRYYSEYQLEMFKVIATLKDVGMSLKEIKHYIDNRSPKNMLKLFEYDIKEIQNEINNLKRRQQILATKMDLIKEGLYKEDGIFLEEIDEELLVLSERIDTKKLPFDLECYSNFINKCYKYNLNYGYPIGTMKSKESLESGISEDYSYFYIKVDKNCNFDNLIVKPKGMYVISYFKGHYANIYPVYTKLLQYIHTNNLEIVGCSYEDVIIEEVAVKNTDDFILKIAIQVKQFT